MKSIHLSKKIATTALTVLIGISTAMAQDATAPAKTSTAGNNLLTLLLVIMGLLVFVISLLGRVLLVLGKQVIEKNKTPKMRSLLIGGLLLLTTQCSSAQETVTTGTVKTVSSYGGLSTGTFYLLVSVLATEIIIIFFLTFLIRRFSAELLPQKKVAPAKANKFKTWWARLNKKLTRAIPVEKEADVMLDHDYDGIRELDNALPPWWKYGFYITIGVAVIYLLNFHVLGYGKNPTQEYQAEMERARIKKEIYESNNKDKIDENNVPMADAAGLAKAKEIFTTTCFACHGKLGEGGAGPNLTDDYWLHKGSLNDIYQSIKHGYPDKGMQSWSTVYTPKEISFLASYIKTLRGTKPANPKAPQGDLYIESSSTTSPTGAGADSLATGK